MLFLCAATSFQETRVQFSVNMTEMITKLMEVSRNAFGQWREQEGAWSMRQFEILSKMLGNKLMLGDACPELMEVSYKRALENISLTTRGLHNYLDATLGAVVAFGKDSRRCVAICLPCG